MRLGELTRVWECSERDPPDEYTTLIEKIGTRETVGKLPSELKAAPLIWRTDTKGLNNYICIKPRDNNRLLPKYLYYMMEYIHISGHWQRVSVPHANKYKIRIKDVKDIAVQEYD